MHWVRDAKLSWDDADRYGVEQAIAFCEASGGGSVMLLRWLQFGDGGALRTAFMGADSAVQVSTTL